MATPEKSRHGMWSSRWLFVLAAAGSAVGLGNIWKFPYIAGENGGGAFVLIYLACVFMIGVPIMMAETMLGRASRQSPINAMRTAVKTSGARSGWVLLGWAGAIAGFLILSYYSVIAGWALYYIVRLGTGEFQGMDGSAASAAFNDLMANPLLILALHTLFMIITVYIVGRGVKGLETAVRWFMPSLFVLLLVLLGYGYQSEGFDQAVEFMFTPDWSAALTTDTLLMAMGQAFFTLSLGMGAIMAYGAYVPANASITTTIGTIALLDTAVAIMSGLAIFPIVFANGLEPAAGPGLMFITVPVAFGQMEYGAVFGAAFFVLVSFAALTSAISLTEPVLAYLVEEYNARRQRVAISVGVITWFIGLGTVFSFNLIADWTLFGRNFFELVDYFTQNIMLPLGGLAIAIFVAYVWNRDTLWEQLGRGNALTRGLWYLLIGFISPMAVVIVFVMTLWPTAIADLSALLGL